MLRKTLLLFCLTFCCISVFSQNAKSIMDATAQKLQAMPAIEALFEAGTFEGATPLGQGLSGTMAVQKEMLRMDSEEMQMWYDGSTQWSHLKHSGEVNVTTPTKEEISTLNPYTFIECYKKGFKLSFIETDYHGTPAYEVLMRPQSKKGYYGIYEIRLTINKRSSLPLCVRLRDKGNTWTRIRIKNLKEIPAANASAFRFDAKANPNLEVIDLR